MLKIVLTCLLVSDMCEKEIIDGMIDHASDKGFGRTQKLYAHKCHDTCWVMSIPWISNVGVHSYCNTNQITGKHTFHA